ncbi:interleukin-18-like [Phascolarctos cinereus]
MAIVDDCQEGCAPEVDCSLHFANTMETGLREDVCCFSGNAPWTQFMLQYYGCDSPTPLVAISVRGRNESYHLTCKSDKEVQFKEGDFPDNIEDKDKDILFQLSKVIGYNKIKFKSFLYPEHYLACEEDSNKLVLKEEFDSEEASTMFTYVTCKKK